MIRHYYPGKHSAPAIVVVQDGVLDTLRDCRDRQFARPIAQVVIFFQPDTSLAFVLDLME